MINSIDFGILLQPDPQAKTIKLPIAVTLSANWQSISTQQAKGKASTKKRKANKIAAQEAKAITAQDKLDELEGAEAYNKVRGEISGSARPNTTLTPTPHAKRVRKKAVVFKGGSS